MLVRGAVLPALTHSDRDGVLREMLDALAAAKVVTAKAAPELLRKVLDRERVSSTGFGHGVAVPHVKHASIKKIAVGLGLSPRGVDFSATDKQPVYCVFMLLSPDNAPEEHLRAMEVIFKHLSKDAFRRSLRQCQSVEQVMELLAETDSHHLSS